MKCRKDIEQTIIKDSLRNEKRDSIKDINDHTLFIRENAYAKGGAYHTANNIADKLNKFYKGEVALRESSSKGESIIIKPSEAVVKVYYDAYIKRWNDENDGNIFNGDEGLHNTDTSNNTVASDEVIAKAKAFLAKVNVDLFELTKAQSKAIAFNATGRTNTNIGGIASALENVVAITEGKMNLTIAEETSHIITDILEQTNPKLFNEMLSKIGSYKIWDTVRKDPSYYDNKAYKTEDNKPDIRALKKEAIGKLVGEYLIQTVDGKSNINDFELASEDAQKLADAQGWWSKVIDWFKQLIAKAGGNPFQETANQIIGEGNKQELKGTADDVKTGNPLFNIEEDKEGEKTRDNNYNKILDTSTKIAKTDNGFEVNGEKVKNSIEFKPSKNADPIVEKLSINAKLDLHDILNRYIGDGGFLLDNPIERDSVANFRKTRGNRDETYITLENNIKERLAEYPRGTKFLHDINIYNEGKDSAANVDLLVFKPNGKTDILSFDFIRNNKSFNSSTTDLSQFQRESMQKYVGQVKYILNKSYGIKDFDRTRSIPITLSYRIDGKSTTINGLKIGGVNSNENTPEHLKPVPTLDERTGNAEVDKLIGKLSGLLEAKESIASTESNKDSKKEEISNTYKALRHLQIGAGLKPIVDETIRLSNNADTILKKFETDFKSIDPKDIDEAKLSEQSINLSNASKELVIYKDIDIHFNDYFKNPTEEEKKTLGDIKLASDRARLASATMLKTVMEFTSEFIAKKYGIDKLLLPERAVNYLTSIFNTFSEPQTKAWQVLYRMHLAAKERYERATRDILTKLDTTGADIKEWINKNSIDKFLDAIKKKDSNGNKLNEWIDKYSKDFYIKLRENVNTGKAEWTKKNIDTKAFEEYIKDYKETRLKKIEELPKSGDEEQDANEKTRQIALLDAKTDLTQDSAWLDYDNIKKFPLDKWHSEEYSNLQKPENKPLLDLYNVGQEINDIASKSGYIESIQKRNFLPFLQTTLLDRLTKGGKYSLANAIISSFTVKDIDLDYGTRDKQTGELINIIPKQFISPIGEEKIGKDGKPYIDTSSVSNDIVKNLMLYGAKVLEYKELTQIEPMAKLLLETEKNKGSIVTNWYGKAVVGADISLGNEKNYEILNDFTRNAIYKQTYTQTTFTDSVSGRAEDKWNKIAAKVNKVFGYNLMSKIEGERRVSLVKTLDMIKRIQELKVLGFNLGTSAYRFLGTNIQALISNEKWTSISDILKSELNHAKMKLYKGDAKLTILMMKSFLPLGDQLNHEIGKLSLNKVTQSSVGDIMMGMVKHAHDWVQWVNFDAMINNTIVVDGKLQNAREYYRHSDEYTARYEASASERKDLEKSFESKVKDLIDAHSIMKYISEKEGKLHIEGVDINSNNFIKYKEVIRNEGMRLSGNISPNNESRIRMMVLGRQMMMFHNWLPGMVKSRFKGLSYNDGMDSYEWGKTRMFASILLDHTMFSIGRLVSMTKGTDKGVEYLNQLYDKKKAQYEDSKGQSFNMTRAEFHDMVRGNIRSEAKELAALLGMVGMVAAAKAYAPDKDDDSKQFWNYSMRILDRSRDELQLYYNPASMQSIANGSIFPAMGFLTDLTTLTQQTFKEGLGLTIGDDNMVKTAHPAKYLMKSFPISKELTNYIDILAPDIAKEMGITISPEMGHK